MSTARDDGLGEPLKTVFGHSMFVCFGYAGDVLAGAGRALADGLDCAYIAEDHPVRQPGD